MALRRHVRLWVIAWLFAQVASLSAFVPRDCCASHRPTIASPACHGAPKATHCPMRATDGTPCPMHRGADGQHDAHAQTGAHDCALRGTCEGPSLFTVFSQAGILPDTSVAAVGAEAATRAPDLREAPVTRTQPPHPRPPRL